MKTALRFPHACVLALAAAAATAPADPPDLTASLEPLCNPNASRWTASQPLARAATSIGVCDGLLFVSGGDWDDNLGPCPIFAVNPCTGSYVKEYESGTESIDYFRIGSDGSLYAPSYNTANSSPLLSTWSTYIFVAKIDIGAGVGGADRVSVAAQPIATGVFSEDWDWAVENVEANLVSGGTPVTYIAFAGQYQTGNYEVAIDQFKIATALDLVCNRAAPAVVLPATITVASTDFFHAGDALP